MIIVEYLDDLGRSGFADWFNRLEPAAASRITVQLERLRLGNLSSVKGLGGGLFEARIDSGPGYRIYFGRDGNQLVILLAGGTKHRQDADISTARTRWTDYKRRRKG